MANIMESLDKALAFLGRRPNLENSSLLKKESDSLAAALQKYNAKAEELELSLEPEYAETAALVEGEAKNRVTVTFIKDFTRKHCSCQLNVQKADKKARTALLTLAAKDQKLQILRSRLDESQQYRLMFHGLMEETESDIRTKVLTMSAKDFSSLVKAVGLEAPHTKSGAVSSSKTAREKVLKQIIRDKVSDELMIGLGRNG